MTSFFLEPENCRNWHCRVQTARASQTDRPETRSAAESLTFSELRPPLWTGRESVLGGHVWSVTRHQMQKQGLGNTSCNAPISQAKKSEAQQMHVTDTPTICSSASGLQVEQWRLQWDLLHTMNRSPKTTWSTKGSAHKKGWLMSLLQIVYRNKKLPHKRRPPEGDG